MPQYGKPDFYQAAPMTLAEYASRWLATAALHPHTVLRYGRWLAHYILPTLGQLPLLTLTRAMIRGTLVTLLANGVGPPTVRNTWIALSGCLAAAVEEGLCEENAAHGAAKKLFRKPKDLRGRALSRSQLRRFLEVADDVTPLLADLFWLLAQSGLRIGEALALQASDVDLERRVIHVTKTWTYGEVGGTKSRRSRTVEISLALAARIEARILDRPGNRWLFQSTVRPWPWHPHHIEEQMAKVLKKAGLPRATPHQLRHSCTVALLEETGDVLWTSRQLGHSSVALTADLYGLGARPKHRDALNRFAEHLRRPPLRARPPVSGGDGVRRRS